jgi:aspartate-semialdehyde dehydrogenase
MLADHPWFELAYATASASRVGLKYASTVHWVMPFEMPKNVRDVEVKEFNMEAMKEAGVKIVFSALPAEVAREAEPQLRDNGFYVFPTPLPCAMRAMFPFSFPRPTSNSST